MDHSNNKELKPKWLTANKGFYRKYKTEREKLKANMTNAEKILWTHLKNKQLGVKFRRQHIIDFYIPDFVALSIKLIIELDGKIHLQKKKDDAFRTKGLELLGYTVIRFKNEDVENRLEYVLEKIKDKIVEMTSPNLSKGEELSPFGRFRGSKK